MTEGFDGSELPPLSGADGIVPSVPSGPPPEIEGYEVVVPPGRVCGKVMEGDPRRGASPPDGAGYVLHAPSYRGLRVVLIAVDDWTAPTSCKGILWTQRSR